MTQDAYTGAQATFSYAGSTIAVGEVDITITRGVAAHPRMGKWSDYKLPGKLDFSGTVKRIQVDGQLLAALVNATPTTGTAGALQAAAVIVAGTAVAIGSDPATASRVTLTLSVDAITTAGSIVVVGTDVNDHPLAEEFTIANGSAAGTVWTGKKVFKTTDYWLPNAVVSTGGGKIAVAGIAGDATVDVGEPKTWDLVARTDDGSNNIVITAANCFFTSGKFRYADADAMGSDDMNFTMKDPDTDLTISYVNA